MPQPLYNVMTTTIQDQIVFVFLGRYVQGRMEYYYNQSVHNRLLGHNFQDQATLFDIIGETITDPTHHIFIKSDPGQVREMFNR